MEKKYKSDKKNWWLDAAGSFYFELLKGIGEEGRGRLALHVHSFLCGDSDAGVFGVDGPEGEEAFLNVEPDVVSWRCLSTYGSITECMKLSTWVLFRFFSYRSLGGRFVSSATRCQRQTQRDDSIFEREQSDFVNA